MNRYLYGAIATIVYEYLSLSRPARMSSVFGIGAANELMVSQPLLIDDSHKYDELTVVTAGAVTRDPTHLRNCMCLKCEADYDDGIGGLAGLFD